MKKSLLILSCILFSAITGNSQVTRINNNNSLHVVYPVTSTKTILVSYIDSSVWVTEGTLASTVQLSPDIKYELSGGLLNGKFLFRGRRADTGSELFITDGTSAGTGLVKDIYTNTASSAPSDFQGLNGFIYFSAETLNEGRELWRSDGTLAGTTLVKDIVTGTASSNREGFYHMFSNGVFMVFAANTAAEGLELWKSDGTPAGTTLLKNINTAADSSDPQNFYILNNLVFFTATSAAEGNEIWKTDGTTPGTNILKDINPGTGSSIDYEIAPGFSFPVFAGFHTFNNHIYFQVTDGTSLGQLWGSDGTGPNTIMLNDIVPGFDFSALLVTNAVNLPGKFIFPVANFNFRCELWQSDGTPAGTTLFKSFPVTFASDIPINLVPYTIVNGVPTQSLFQGSKFFFAAGEVGQGNELWISDGTLAGTSVVKDINSGTNDAIDFNNNFSYLYTNTDLFFAATDGITGNELWKTAGTNPTTSLVKDINLNAANADPELSIINNSKIIFSATDGDHITNTDLFVVDGEFAPVPVKLGGFTVKALNKDAVLQWHTLEELNTAGFTLQRSYDGLHFENIASISATGNSSTRQDYKYNDRSILLTGKPVYYYRLLVTDIDGKETRSEVVFLKTKVSPWNVRLNNSMIDGQLEISLTGIREGNFDVSVHDVSGKTLISQKLSATDSRLTLPIDKLARGTYVMRIMKDQEMRSLKFIR
jgi:ELWxxDGT repeat protein